MLDVGPSYTKAWRRVVSVLTSLSLLREICFFGKQGHFNGRW